MATPERFRDLFSVEVRTRHEVRRIDRQKQTIEVLNIQTGAISEEPYDALVLATGAEPVRPPLVGIDLPGIFALRNLDDMDQIHAWIANRGVARAVVVGGGYIGLEMVENLMPARPERDARGTHRPGHAAGRSRDGRSRP